MVNWRHFYVLIGLVYYVVYVCGFVKSVADVELQCIANDTHPRLLG